MAEPQKLYAVFLSFNSEDRETVEQIARYLADKAELRPWFDQWELIPGEPWMRNLERGLEASMTCAIFIGQSGEGPWQRREVETALRHQVKNTNFRVIPVLLSDAPKQPELPIFLSGNMWVDFRGRGLDDDNALWRLECGIRGESPGRGRPLSESPENTSTTKQTVSQPAAGNYRDTPPDSSASVSKRSPNVKSEMEVDLSLLEQEPKGAAALVRWGSLVSLTCVLLISLLWWPAEFNLKSWGTWGFFFTLFLCMVPLGNAWRKRDKLRAEFHWNLWHTLIERLFLQKKESNYTGIIS
jgi:hypothetical protein